MRIHRVHLEEDAAKLTHVGASGRIHGSDASIVDFNRGGTPLAEIVTEPDMRSAEQAGEWLKLLRSTLRQLGVSDVNMEEGSLRCDANISLRPAGTSELGVKTELKNMNSFRFIERGIRAEIARQAGDPRGRRAGDPGDAALRPRLGRDHLAALQGGGARLPLLPRARPAAGGDRRADARRRPRAAMSELPADARRAPAARARAERRERAALAFRGELGDYFEAALAAGAEPRAGAAGARQLDHRRAARAPGRRRGPGRLARAAGRARGARRRWSRAKRVSVGAARQVLDRLVADGGDPQAIVEAEGLAAIDGGDELAAIVAAALAANADAAERVREGNAKAIGPIVGHVMRETKGRADGTEVARLIARAARHLSAGRSPRTRARREILDDRPKAIARRRAPICCAMNRSAANPSVSSPRRFILLPEEPADGAPHGPRIRRYRLTSVGQGAVHRSRPNGADLATARIAGEFGTAGPHVATLPPWTIVPASLGRRHRGAAGQG